MRTVTVKYTPKVLNDLVVRFEGDTFGALQNRLLDARVPEVTTKSYIEIFVPNEGFVCLLPSETLPLEKRLEVNVHVAQASIESQGVPALPETVTGQPVPQADVAIAPELDWRAARKEQKLNRKLAKINMKLENLKLKQNSLRADGAVDRTQSHSEGASSQVARPQQGHPCAWGRASHSLHAILAQPLGPILGTYGYPPAAGSPSAGRDPSGANCQAEEVRYGKA